MINLPPEKRRGQEVTWEDFNAFRAAIIRNSIQSFSGPDARLYQDPRGISLSISGAAAAARRMFIAEVIEDSTGGGYYSCYLQTLDADDWDLDNNPLDNIGNPVVVLNLAEVGADRHELDATDKIICWKFTDDEGNTRYVGIAALRIGTKADTVTATSDTLGGKFISLWLGEW